MIYGKENGHPAGDPWKAKQIKLASLSSLHRSRQLPSKSVFSLYIITNVLKNRDNGMTPPFPPVVKISTFLWIWRINFPFITFTFSMQHWSQNGRSQPCSHAGINPEDESWEMTSFDSAWNCGERGGLEIQACSCWMGGMLCFQTSKWAEAQSLLTKAKTIYASRYEVLQ